MTREILGARIAWIGAPGNMLLATRAGGESQVLLRTSGLFTDVASDGRDVFVTDTMRTQGVILRVTGTTASRIASLDVRPLARAIDAANVYVLSERTILAVPQTGGAPRLVLGGDAMEGLEVMAGSLFTTAQLGPSRALLRVPTEGGAPVVLERGVRRGPFATFAGQVYFLDADAPALRRVDALGGRSAVVARAPELPRVTELVVDASAIFVATEDDLGPVVLAFRVHRDPGGLASGPTRDLSERAIPAEGSAASARPRSAPLWGGCSCWRR